MSFASVRLFGGALSIALLFGCSTPSTVKSGRDNTTGELGSPTAQHLRLTCRGPRRIWLRRG